LSRKQAGRLTKYAAVFTDIRYAKRVFLNDQLSSKTEITSRLLAAILDETPFKVDDKLESDVFSVKI